jgi:hypothetical protein
MSSKTFVCGMRDFVQARPNSVQDEQTFGQAELNLVQDGQSLVPGRTEFLFVPKQNLSTLMSGFGYLEST